MTIDELYFLPYFRKFMFSIVWLFTTYKMTIFLDPSGMTNYAPNNTSAGSNGLALNQKGDLILCQHGDRALARLKNWSFKIVYLSSSAASSSTSVGKTASLAQNVVQKVAFGLPFPISTHSTPIPTPHFGHQKVGFAFGQPLVFLPKSKS